MSRRFALKQDNTLRCVLETRIVLCVGKRSHLPIMAHAEVSRNSTLRRETSTKGYNQPDTTDSEYAQPNTSASPSAFLLQKLVCFAAQVSVSVPFGELQIDFSS